VSTTTPDRCLFLAWSWPKRRLLQPGYDICFLQLQIFWKVRQWISHTRKTDKVSIGILFFECVLTCHTVSNFLMQRIFDQRSLARRRISLSVKIFVLAWLYFRQGQFCLPIVNLSVRMRYDCNECPVLLYLCDYSIPSLCRLAYTIDWILNRTVFWNLLYVMWHAYWYLYIGNTPSHSTCTLLCHQFLNCCMHFLWRFQFSLYSISMTAPWNCCLNFS